MVRFYKRKTHRSDYSYDTLVECLNAVRNKTMSLREASRSFSIPRSTIEKLLKSPNPDGMKQLAKFLLMKLSRKSCLEIEVHSSRKFWIFRQHGECGSMAEVALWSEG